MVMSKALPAQSNGAPRNFPEFRYDLGAQLSSGSNYPAALEPEIRLMLMILEDAIACYQRFLNAQNDPALRQFREAERWLFGGDEDWIFSFNHICSYIRRRSRLSARGFKAMSKCSGDELSRGGGFAESPSRYEKARDQSARSRAVIERLPAL
jgi:hypothetical protein